MFFVILGISYGLLRWRIAIEKTDLTRFSLSAITKMKIFASNLTIDVLYQKSIADCSRVRWISHFAIFWGFLGLAVTTTLDEIVNPAAGPLTLLSPVRILGNVSGIIFMMGISFSLIRRIIVPSVRKNSTLGDAVFLLLLFFFLFC